MISAASFLNPKPIFKYCLANCKSLISIWVFRNHLCIVHTSLVEICLGLVLWHNCILFCNYYLLNYSETKSVLESSSYLSYTFLSLLRISFWKQSPQLGTSLLALNTLLNILVISLRVS